MSDIVTSVLTPQFARLSTSIDMSVAITKADANTQKRTRVTDGVNPELVPFTGVPANSLNITQCKTWAQFSDDKHTRRVRMFLKFSPRPDISDIKDALVELANHYQVRSLYFRF